jgi:hypothetical protein
MDEEEEEKEDRLVGERKRERGARRKEKEK